jgi:preprotein translocase subunit YajC
MFNISSFLMMAPPPSADGQSGGFGSMVPTLIMFAAIILIFYFLMIRPQKKRQQEHQNMLNALKPGDKIVTTSGMHGKIEQVNEKTIVVAVDNVRFTFEKSAVVQKVD